MNHRRTATAISVVALTAILATTTVPAHAIGPDVWTHPWPWEGPGTGQINAAQSAVQTLNCRAILATEVRTDRATRYHRVEDLWPGPTAAAVYPANQNIRSVLAPAHTGWNVVYSWTPGHPGMDLQRVVWVPACTDDLDPATAPAQTGWTS